jgi:hypothetical protein
LGNRAGDGIEVWPADGVGSIDEDAVGEDLDKEVDVVSEGPVDGDEAEVDVAVELVRKLEGYGY